MKQILITIIIIIFSCSTSYKDNDHLNKKYNPDKVYHLWKNNNSWIINKNDSIYYIYGNYYNGYNLQYLFILKNNNKK